MAKILVVDDDQGMRELLEIMLTGEGYKVSTAPDAEKALDPMPKRNIRSDHHGPEDAEDGRDRIPPQRSKIFPRKPWSF